MSESTSYFDGSVLENLITSIVAFLIALITLCIGLPWAVAYRTRWVTSHTVIEGKRLSFDGQGIQLFGNYIKWYLLSIVTLGIYGLLFVPVRLQQWVVKHTSFK
ncbi:MAG: DUF898 domain-containing protein [Spirochaetales bacterium]|nr:DUF898 domain-containing protein [Spirochaetales bacterium]